MGMIGETARRLSEPYTSWLCAEMCGPPTFAMLHVPGCPFAPRLPAREPLQSVRASGDAGHEVGCARDHLLPGVCSTAEVS